MKQHLSGKATMRRKTSCHLVARVRLGEEAAATRGEEQRHRCGSRRRRRAVVVREKLQGGNATTKDNWRLWSWNGEVNPKILVLG